MPVATAPTLWVSTSNPTHRVESSLSNEEALAICREMKSNDFAQKISTAPQLSHNMMVWAHILANKQIANEKTQKPAVKLGDFEGIQALFNNATSALKRPKIRLRVDNHPITLYVAGERSKYAGSIMVNSGSREDNVWYGSISTDGVFHPSKNCFEALTEMLQKFAEEPVAVAREYGQSTGQCCFCGLTLTDDRSVKVGYGPICSSNWGLPWG